IYEPTAAGLPLVPERAGLVSTAHDEEPLRLVPYRPLFQLPRAFGFLTPEERDLVHARFRNEHIPSEVLGIGLDAPPWHDPEPFREHYAPRGPLVFYLGQVSEGKAVDELLADWIAYRESGGAGSLVLAGTARMPIPKRDDIVALGRVSDEEKYALLEAADALVLPSHLESPGVVQRYGDVPGGGEGHARVVVQRLKPYFAIEVATTNSTDYLTWNPDLTAGLDQVDGVTVRRFPVERPRAWNFKLYERRAFRSAHTLDDERAFIDAQGPYAPELLDFLFKRGRDYDHVLFFTYIYYPTVLGLPLVPDRAVLVPTAHEESAIGLAAYKPVFHGPRAIPSNTDAERQTVGRRFPNERVSN